MHPEGSLYVARLKALFWIGVSNFVFPVILNLVQLIFVFRDPSFLDGSYVFMVNTYVQIIGVLLATMWSTGTRWYQEDEEGGSIEGESERTTMRTVPLKRGASVMRVSGTETSHERQEDTFHIYDVRIHGERDEFKVFGSGVRA